jgi:molybdopterin/thiamine biosynthesis adenylyltransferase
MQTDLTDAQLERYARHVVLDEVGEDGQLKLLNARVLVVGAGGLGSPMIQYLAAAGVGRIGIVDDDTVDISNLQRQTIHRLEDVGRPKAQSAADFVHRLNPEIMTDIHVTRLTEGNAAALVADYDVIADGTDNFRTRYLLNDMCVQMKRTLVSAALLRFDGQLGVFKPHAGANFPCYRCIFPEEPPADLIPRCETAGIFGAVAGILGSLQATEVLKELLGLGDTMAGRLMLYDGLSAQIRIVKVKRRPDCPSCGAI